MLVALGLLLGLLLALFMAPPLWRRAVRLTTRRIEATMPMSLADIRADKDQLRAEFAVHIRKAELALEKAKEKSARLLVDANKRRVALTGLEQTIKEKTAEVSEMRNANRVLEQTIKKRLPELEGLLREAHGTIAQQDERFGKLNAAYAAETDALLQSRQGARKHVEEIESLRLALEGPQPQKGARRRVIGAAPASEEAVRDNQRLTAEVSRLREQLTQLEIAEVNETAQLKSELRGLADRLVAAATAEGNRAADSVLLLTQPISVPFRKAVDAPAGVSLGGAMPQPEDGPRADAEAALPMPAPIAAEPSVAAEAASPEAAPAADSEPPKPTELEEHRREKRRRRRMGLDRRSTLVDRLRGIEAEKV